LALGPLTGYTGYVLRRAQVALFEDFINAFKPLGLRPAQFSVLLVIDANPGRRQSEIAAALGIRQANLVGLIDELDRRNLTKRKRLPEDRRSHALVLTAKGTALLKQGIALQARFEQRLIAELGATEHARLVATLTKLHRVLTAPDWAVPGDGAAPPRRRVHKSNSGNARAGAAGGVGQGVSRRNIGPE
jgi:DNA-binding MarR family transcriptional regulator